MTTEDIAPYLWLALISTPVIMIFNADNKLKAMQRAARKADRERNHR